MNSLLPRQILLSDRFALWISTAVIITAVIRVMYPEIAVPDTVLAAAVTGLPGILLERNLRARLRLLNADRWVFGVAVAIVCSFFLTVFVQTLTFATWLPVLLAALAAGLVGVVAGTGIVRAVVVS